jgi:hypothetical protein
VKQGSTSLALGPLNQLENLKLEKKKKKKKNNYITRMSGLWIPLNFTIPVCCVQFYIP